MSTTVVDYVKVQDRLTDLGCSAPQGIAILPANFEKASTCEEFVQLSEAASVRTLFRNQKIPMSSLLPDGAERGPYIQNNSFEWLAPTLFISAAVMTNNPTAVALALDVLGTYLTDFFKGIPGPKTVKLEIVVEKKRDRSCKMVRYEGGVSGINELPEVIRQLSDE